jgi:hypothetical protein
MLLLHQLQMPLLHQRQMLRFPHGLLFTQPLKLSNPLLSHPFMPLKRHQAYRLQLSLLLRGRQALIPLHHWHLLFHSQQLLPSVQLFLRLPGTGYLGCFQINDDGTPRLTHVQVNYGWKDATPEHCSGFCSQNSYQFSAVAHGSTC